MELRFNDLGVFVSLLVSQLWSMQGDLFMSSMWLLTMVFFALLSLWESHQDLKRARGRLERFRKIAGRIQELEKQVEEEEAKKKKVHNKGGRKQKKKNVRTK